MQKVRTVNLERGRPSADEATRNMVGQLGTYKRLGYRALILIHGWGSSGVGGAIRTAVRRKLGERSVSGLVSAYCGGEEWAEHRRMFTEYCSQLKQYERDIDGNRGVTVVLLK